MPLPANESPAKGKRSYGLIFSGLVWTAFSSIFLVGGVWMLWKTAATHAWEKVPCVIERFEITADQKADPPFRPDLVFRYEVNGQGHTGTRLWPKKKGSDDYEDLAEIRESYAQGPEGRLASIQGVAAQCRVNPSNSAEAALLPEGKGSLWGGLAFMIFGGSFVAIGIISIVAAFRGEKRREERSSSSKEAPVGILVIFSIVFIGAGLAILFDFTAPRAWDWWQMRGWRETPAEIIWSRVRVDDSGESTTYTVDLFYRYQIEGREYRSNRYALADNGSSGPENGQATASKYPPGSKLTVFVDPDKPWRAVMKRRIGWSALLLLFPLPFLAFGFGGLWWALKGRHRRKAVSNAEGKHVPAVKVLTDAPPLVTGQWQRTRVGSGCGFALVLVFAILWNGIIGAGVAKFLSDLDSPGWPVSAGMLLLMVPFVLIGLCLVGLSIYVFLSLFGPVYEMRLDDSGLLPGFSTRLHWRRAKGAGSLRDFHLMLVGREEASYSNGSTTSTATSVFHEETLFESTIPLAMDQGQVEVRIPREALPTFQGKHNRVRWFICLRAKVARLPDLRDDQEILVLPPRNESNR